MTADKGRGRAVVAVVETDGRTGTAGLLAVEGRQSASGRQAWPWLAGAVEQQCDPDCGPAILAST